MRRAVKTALWLSLLPLLGLAAVGTCELYTELLSAPYCHAKAAECTTGNVGLVLGCSKYMARGRENAFFTGRIRAAADLWHAGKLSCIIVSGDNRQANYNEPREMRKALLEQGVPADRIVCDYAGLRTLDSVVRAQKVFGATDITIISQKEHVERAVAIARRHGIRAEGYEAPLCNLNRASWLRQAARERAARMAMVVDFITNRQPRHLGEPVPLPL